MRAHKPTDEELARQEVAFSRRTVLLGIGKLFLLSTTAVRLFQLQITEGDYYSKRSEENRISPRLLIPSRGQLQDRNGKVLATNKNAYQAILLRDHCKNWRSVLKKVQQLLHLSDKEMDLIYKEAKAKPSFFPILVKDNLTWDEVSYLEIHLTELTGFYIEQGETRVYPEKDICSHIIGYVARVSEEEQDGTNLLNNPLYRIGKCGVEKALENVIRGKEGMKRIEVDAHGRDIKLLSTAQSKAGSNIKLTIDLELQKYAMELLKEHRRGATVLIDTFTGGILCMASVPGYDTNLFINGISKTDWKLFQEDPDKALINKCIAGTYAPGSTFKMMVGMTGLETGAITEKTAIHCPGYFPFGGHNFHCWRWKQGGHGPIKLVDAIKSSCDVFFYNVANRTGIDPLADICHRFGLGHLTGLGLKSEKPGIIPSTEWKQRTLGQKWFAGDTISASIGQGYVVATPLQLAVMAARLATGVQVTPRLYLDGNSKFAPMNINQDHLKLVQEGMAKVVNEPGGTAYKVMIDVDGKRMAGKTGTAQVRAITDSDRASNFKGKEWDEKDHSWFVAFAPLENPRFACATLVEHGGFGSQVSAPITQKLMIAAQDLKGL